MDVGSGSGRSSGRGGLVARGSGGDMEVDDDSGTGSGR